MPTVHFEHRPRKRSLTPEKVKRFGGVGAPSPDTGPKTNGVKVTITPSLANCDQISELKCSTAYIFCSNLVTVTPDCLRALYSVNYTPVATDRNSFGIGVWSS